MGCSTILIYIFASTLEKVFKTTTANKWLLTQCSYIYYRKNAFTEHKVYAFDFCVILIIENIYVEIANNIKVYIFSCYPVKNM